MGFCSVTSSDRSVRDTGDRVMARAGLSSGGSESELHAPLDASVREHAANVVRARVAVTLGATFWPSFAIVDWLMTRTVYPTSFLELLWLRLALSPIHFFVLWRLLRRRGPGPKTLRLYDFLLFCSTSAALALLSTKLGGIAGPYTPGVFLVLICRSAFILQPWREALIPSVLVVFTHFVTLLLSERLWPGSIFVLPLGDSLALLALHLTSLSLGAGMLVATSNTAWTLRRRVFEARTLGTYRLIERIAEGGHGEVWKAYHSVLKQTVAIKVLKSDIAEDDRALARFEHEIHSLCQLSHPNTIRIRDHGVTADGVCYYVMELLEGVNLAELVRTEGPPSPARVTYLLQQTARALSEAHGRGILHRDIKPENVFVSRSATAPDFVRLIDFGIAKRFTSASQQSPLTRTGMVIGTPAFMAPEVARGDPAGFQSDVYALGAVGYFLLTGMSPPEISTGGVALQAMATVMQKLRTPSDLAQILLRCLCADPSRRFTDAGAAAQALDSLSVAEWPPSEKDGDAVRSEVIDTPTASMPKLR